MTFLESNTVEQMSLNATMGLGGKGRVLREDATPHDGESFGAELCPARWSYASNDQVLCQFTFRVSSMGDFRERIEHASEQNSYREPTR
jgi:hypothetical protein